MNNSLIREVGLSLPRGNACMFVIINRYAFAFLETFVARKPGHKNVLNRKDPMLTKYAVKFGK